MSKPDSDAEHERNRLAMLDAYRILDSPRDSDFDEITKLAAAIFEVPICLISLVDQDRQWFKSKVGLDASETPRGWAFCATAINSDKVMVVRDAHQDPRFMKNPLVTGAPTIRFYAGAPLLTTEGYALGTLCVIDQVAREFSPQQQATLTLLSHQVVNLLALRKKSHELSDALVNLQKLDLSQKEAQTKSRESEQRLLFALGAAEIGDWNMDLRTNVAVRSMQHDQCFGYTEAVPEWGYDTFLTHVHPADRERVDATYSSAMGIGGDYDVEFRAIWPDGTEHWLWSRASFYFDELDRPCRVAGIVVDITRRKQSESVSRYLEDRYQQLFEKSMDAVLQTTPDGGVLTANPAACTLFAMSEDELVRRGRDSLIDTRDPRLAAFLQTRSETGHARGELRMRRGDGQLFEAEISSSIYADPQGVRLISKVIRDVTERKQAEAARASLEAQLRESQKMEAMGILAGGIAHEFNNILTAIMGNTGLAMEDVRSRPDDALFSLEEIDVAAKRARTLVQQILTFSHKGAQTFALQPVRPPLEEAIRLLRSTLPDRVALAVAFADAPLYARMDATQIEQVLNNLCTNALHAIPSGPGRIEIKVDAVLLDQAAAKLSPDLHPGQYVRFSVIDTGCGMDAATRAHIFEPFFTTKGVGVGTGLGLSVVHGIVSAHQGAVTVESTPGKGTRFDVYLPAVAAPTEAAWLTDAAPAGVDGQGKHVLYVDDDESLVTLVGRVLQKAGYRVTGHMNGRQAVDAVRADPHSFDLVVSDYNMPGMSGLEVATEVKSIRADLPVVIFSGYVTEELCAAALKAGVREVIGKSGSVDGLCQSIQRLFLTWNPQLTTYRYQYALDKTEKFRSPTEDSRLKKLTNLEHR